MQTTRAHYDWAPTEGEIVMAAPHYEQQAPGWRGLVIGRRFHPGRSPEFGVRWEVGPEAQDRELDWHSADDLAPFVWPEE